jgi:methionyl-tRNA formyltransferase
MSKNKLIILTGYDSLLTLKALDNYDFDVLIPKVESSIIDSVRKNFRNVFGKRLLEVDYKEYESFLSNYNPKFLCTLGWRRIISNQVLDQCERAVNIHPALLPEYKGYHPVPYVLINNESHHGITAHLISENVDEGDIIYQERFKIDKFSNLNILQQKVHKMMPKFMLELIKLLYSSDYELVRNDTTKTKVIAGKRKPSDSEMSLNTCLADAYDLIRSCDSKRFPAFIIIEGRKVFLSLTYESSKKS